MRKQKTKQNGMGGFRHNFPAAAVSFTLLLMAAFLIAGVNGLLGQKQGTSSSSSSASSQTAGTASSAAGAASAGTAVSAASSSDGYVLAASSAGSVPQASSETASQAASGSSIFPQEPEQDADSGDTEAGMSAGSDSGSTLQDDYSLLSDGMTYDEAEQICGKGTLVTEVGSTQVYEWHDTHSDGSFLRATFKDGKLARKYKFGF